MREGGITQTDMIIGAEQGAVSEEAAMFVKDRTGLKVEAEVGWCRKKTIDWEDRGKRNIREDMILSDHSEAKP